MPELPEVETVVRDLRKAGLTGRRILDISVRWEKLVAGISAGAFIRQVKNKTILDITRRGKFIVFRLSGGAFLLVHLRMTGQFTLRNCAEPRDPHEHLVLRLNNRRELRYRDTRKFGRWLLTRNPAAILQRLGPEPLSSAFSAHDLAMCLAGRSRTLKPRLLDQTCLAGLGNIYVDESLWQARLHPRRQSDSLNNAEIKALHRAIRATLQRGIRYRGTTLGLGQSHFSSLGDRGRHQNHLNVYGRSGKPCPRCHKLIQRLVIGQRSTHICPACQILARSLA